MVATTILPLYYCDTTGTLLQYYIYTATILLYYNTLGVGALGSEEGVVDDARRLFKQREHLVGSGVEQGADWSVDRVVVVSVRDEEALSPSLRIK